MSIKNEMSRQVALITGASAGIGLALAHEFAGQGHDLLLVARNLDRLEHLKANLSAQYHVSVYVVPLDLQHRDSYLDLYAQVQELDLCVEYVVNNAGVLVNARAADASIDDLLTLTDVNIRAATALMHCFIPDMIKRGHGTILNVASMSGLVPVPEMATYSASKAYLLSISKSIKHELRGTGVELLVLVPGVVTTDMSSQISYGWFYNLLPTMTAKEVARVTYDGILAQRAVIIPGFFNNIIAVGIRVLPHWLTANMAGWFAK